MHLSFYATKFLPIFFYPMFLDFILDVFYLENLYWHSHSGPSERLIWNGKIVKEYTRFEFTYFIWSLLLLLLRVIGHIQGICLCILLFDQFERAHPEEITEVFMMHMHVVSLLIFLSILFWVLSMSWSLFCCDFGCSERPKWYYKVIGNVIEFEILRSNFSLCIHSFPSSYSLSFTFHLNLFKRPKLTKCPQTHRYREWS